MLVGIPRTTRPTWPGGWRIRKPSTSRGLPARWGAGSEGSSAWRGEPEPGDGSYAPARYSVSVTWSPQFVSGLVLLTDPFGDRAVHREVVRCCAAPVPPVRRCRDDVAGADADDVAAARLHESGSLHHVEGLAQRMRMPGCACARGEVDGVHADARRRLTHDDGIDPHVAGEPLGGPLAEGFSGSISITPPMWSCSRWGCVADEATFRLSCQTLSRRHLVPCPGPLGAP